MNKNNFFVKFAHLYLANLKEMRDTISEIWDTIVDDFLLALLKIILELLLLIFHVILCFLLVPTIIGIFTIQYLTSDEVKRLKGGDEYVEYHGGYFRKKDIKEHENKLLTKKKLCK